MTHRKNRCALTGLLPCLWALLLPACSTDYEDRTIYNDVEIPFEATFRPDTIRFGELPASSARYLLNLDDPSTAIVDNPQYRFRTDELFTIRTTDDGDMLRITSWSAKTVHDVTLEMYLPEAGCYIPVAFLDSIPGFSQFEFKPSFVGTRSVIRTPGGDFVSFECPYLDLGRMPARLASDDEHFRMLSRIDAQWTCGFSNYGWTPDAGESHSYRELRPIYAREWVVIVTNYAYMMTTPEYEHAMTHFREVMGGDLYDNTKTTFTADTYLSEMERFKAPKNFNLGQSSDAVGGLGGGAIWTISHWNFYGHYASFSGWSIIAHEFMHCMGYSHDSNMTYSAANDQGAVVGWTEFIWQLHLWLSRKGDLPYTDRNLLGFHRPENEPYRDGTITAAFQDDAALEQQIMNYYERSRVVQYFKEHPLD